MDIATVSINQNQAEVMQKAGVAVLAMSLDNLELLGDSMVKMMEQSVNPNLGKNIDISV